MEATGVGQEISTPSEPIGEVILGNIDPSTLTREQFLDSPDLLFHGSKEEFNVREFSGKLGTGDSQTLGVGLYTTSDKDEAEKYSRLRKGSHNTTQPVVIPLLPYQARMFDFRSSNDPNMNTAVPVEMAQNWKRVALDYLREEIPRMNSLIDLTSSEGRLNIILVKKLMNDRDALVALGDKPADVRKLISPSGHSFSTLTGKFAEFMGDLGYDGIVFNEGGDAGNFGNAPSYIFYNLEKIGTYEIWHPEVEGVQIP